MPRAADLLRRADFRRMYLAVAASELGDSLHYIALMWFAFDVGGAGGVIAVRLADSIPAFLFGLHGGLAADRFSRKRLMVSADLVRGVVLVPIAFAGLAGALPLWGLVVASFVLESATSFFAPAYGAIIPTLVDRQNVQRANALVQSTTQALSIGGWALAAAFLTFMPVSAFFGVNAASFFVSASLLTRLRHGGEHDPHGEAPQLRDGLAALRPRPTLTAGVVALGVAVTLTTGTWIGGVPKLVRDTLHHGAGGFSLVMVGYAAGSIVSGIVLAHLPTQPQRQTALHFALQRQLGQERTRSTLGSLADPFSNGDSHSRTQNFVFDFTRTQSATTVITCAMAFSGRRPTPTRRAWASIRLRSACPNSI